MEKIKQLKQRATALWGQVREQATPRARKGAAVAASITLFVGLLAYGAGAQSQQGAIDDARDAQRTEASRVSSRDIQLKAMTEQRDDAQQDLIDARTAHRAEIAKMEADAEQRDADLAAREAAVTEAEAVQARREFTGGTVIVGDQIEAGTYRTGEVGEMCYYAWKSDTSSSARIIDNNIVQEGTATVTLSDGDVFESSRCGTWTKIS